MLAISLPKALWVDGGLRFGPQTALDGRPPALMEADPDGRRSLRYRGESRRGGVLSSAVAPQGRLSEADAVGQTCERGVWNLTEKPILISPNPPSPALPLEKSQTSRLQAFCPRRQAQCSDGGPPALERP